jgi:hypothetical protein
MIEAPASRAWTAILEFVLRWFCFDEVRESTVPAEPIPSMAILITMKAK